jgi:hypothetical protein
MYKRWQHAANSFGSTDPAQSCFDTGGATTHSATGGDHAAPNSGRAYAITPHLIIKGAAEAIEFYKRAHLGLRASTRASTTTHCSRSSRAAQPSSKGLKKPVSHHWSPARVQKGTNWGFVDRGGRVVIEPQGDSVTPFAEGTGGV